MRYKNYLCNMKNIMLHIRYLLTQHDCVVVPGWGALVVQHSNAVFDFDNNVITPPHRWVSFSPALAHNDGILAHSIMRSCDCSYEHAMSLIEEQVSQWRDDMSRNGVVEWEKIGVFRKQDNMTMLFSEASDVEISAALSLLQPLSLPTLTQVLKHADAEEEVSNVEENETTAPQIHISWHRRAWQAVASIVAIVMVMLSISTPVDDFQASQDYASLVAIEMLGYTPDQMNEDMELPMKEMEETLSVDAENTSNIEVSGVETDNCTESVSQIYSGTMQQIENVDVETIEVANEHPLYILVIGSLPSLSQAQKQIANFYDAGINQEIKIYETGGKYRLYIDGYDMMSQAQSKLDALLAQPDAPFAGVWICSTRK